MTGRKKSTAGVKRRRKHGAFDRKNNLSSRKMLGREGMSLRRAKFNLGPEIVGLSRNSVPRCKSEGQNLQGKTS